jgi:hypothetical protein
MDSLLPDFAGMSVQMNALELRQQVSIGVMSKVMEVAEVQGDELMKLLGVAAENVIPSELGQMIDVAV